MMQSPHVQVWSFYHIFCFLSIWRAGWGVKRESNFKKYINDLHTSCFFFTYPLVRPKTTPCLSASPPLSPFSSSYLLTTEIVLCHGWLIIVFVHVYKVLIVNILLLEPHLKIWSPFNIRFLYFSVVYSNVHFSLLADDCFHFLAIYRLLCIHDKGFVFPIDLARISINRA